MVAGGAAGLALGGGAGDGAASRGAARRFEATALNSVRKRDVTLMSLECIRTKIQNVFRVFDVVQIPIAFPQVGEICCASIA